MIVGLKSTGCKVQQKYSLGKEKNLSQVSWDEINPSILRSVHLVWNIEKIHNK